MTDGIDDAAAIADFWEWWAGSGDAVVAELDAQEPLGPAVSALLDQAEVLGLDCELSPGVVARHALCMSANGDPRLRKLAHRWHEAAPGSDEGIEFHPHRLAVPDPMQLGIRLEGVEVRVSDLRFAVGVDESHERLDLTVATPAWPDEVRAQAVFLSLDAILGEDRVERWIGGIEFADLRSFAGTVDAAGLAQAVAELESGARAEPTWSLLQKVDEEGAVHELILVPRPLKPIDFPLFDAFLECRVEVPRDENGELQLADSQAAEEALRDQFAGRMLHAASITSIAGERRALFYLDSEDGATVDELERAARARGFEVERYFDPAWEAVRPFR